jgi:hypothetical protein
MWNFVTNILLPFSICIILITLISLMLFIVFDYIKDCLKNY